MQLADLDVLIVDDHEAMRTLLARVLLKAGVERIRDAAGGAEALAMLCERPATLILADQSMPGMDGTAFVSAVRADASLGAPKIFIVSGKSSKEHEAAALAAGADAVLVKPVSPRELLAAINALVAI
jgi:two-component system chemotaxis response regulator CheY